MSAAAAAEPPAASGADLWKAVNPPARALPALEPGAPAPPSVPELELRPVRLASANLYTLSGASLLPAESQTVGYSGGGGMNRHVQWMLGGALIGLVVGAVDGDPFGKTIIGGALGFGLSWVIPL
jgi:hypothetical protein